MNTVSNYFIAHVWGNTDNPLFFSLMWNYCLVPHYAAFLSDKDDDSHKLVERFKDILETICIELYNPKELMKSTGKEIDLRTHESNYSEEAIKMIKDGKINFLPNYVSK